jgi:hypothetical protein
MTRGGLIEPRASMFAPPASSEQIAEITRLGGRPPQSLTRAQAAKAINALRGRGRDRARLSTQTASA